MKQSRRFLKCVEDNFLTQLVSEPRMRKRLRYLMPSFPHSLAVAAIFLRVLGPLSWKTGTGSRMKPP